MCKSCDVWELMCVAVKVHGSCSMWRLRCGGVAVVAEVVTNPYFIACLAFFTFSVFFAKKLFQNFTEARLFASAHFAKAH